MKTYTSVKYEISTSQGLNIIEVFYHWIEVEDWEKENRELHPNQRVTGYSIKQVIRTENWLK